MSLQLFPSTMASSRSSKSGRRQRIRRGRLRSGPTSFFLFSLFVAVPVILLSCKVNTGSSLDLATCNATLGLESGDLADHALSASSSFDDHSTGPQNARLNQDRHGGAWCPKPAIAKNTKEWLQVDLHHLHIVSGIVTQGRYGKGKGQEYLQHFMLEYRRPKTTTALSASASASGQDPDWRIYTDRKGDQIFRANSDTRTAIYTRLDPPLFTRQLRIVPYSVHPRIVCLRFELHGCQDQSGILSYSTPPPDLPGSTNITLGDRTQWWSEQDIGVLNDGNYGANVLQESDVPSYDKGWLGWKRKGASRPIELTFEFSEAKNFSAISIFASNRFDLNIQVFKRAVVWFTGGGDEWGMEDFPYQSSEPIKYEYMPDVALQNSREVVIPIAGGGRVGRFVKIHLLFENVWLLISEVTFTTSEVVFLPEDAMITVPASTATTPVASSKPRPSKTTPSSVANDDNTKKNQLDSHAREGIKPVEHTEENVYMEVIIGVLTAVTLLLFFLFVALLLYSRRQKFLSSPTSRSLNPFPVQINMKELLTTLTPSSSHHHPASSAASPPPPPPPTVPPNITSNPNYSDDPAQRSSKASAITTSFYEAYRGQQPPFEESPQLLLEDLRTKWHSTGHVPDGRGGFRSSLACVNGGGPASQSSASNVKLNNNVNVSEYASVDIQNLGGNGVVGRSVAVGTGGVGNDASRGGVLHHYRSLQQPSPLPPPGASGAAGGGTAKRQRRSENGSVISGRPPVYNLGNYFPRVASEPPTRKTYSTATRERDLKILPMAPTVWNLTTTVQALCNNNNKQQTLSPLSSGTTTTSPSSTSSASSPSAPSAIEEIPRSQLRLKEAFGRGCLGEVALCEIESAYSNIPQTVSVRSSSTSLSSSMTSKDGVLDNNDLGGQQAEDKEDFLRECRLLASLQHPNVVRFLGVVCSGDGDDDVEGEGGGNGGRRQLQRPFCAVLEHSLQGDLYHCLSQQQSTSFSYHRLLVVATQVATGMKYLESRNIVHKDLAARNCLLTDSNLVKISDVAMGISLFNSDYSEVRGRSCAPIRWQPWETILLGRLTTSSNVWSYAVTVWEILTLCRHRPFSLLTDVEVVQNAEHVYYHDTMQMELPEPELCDKDVWELLEECWHRDDHSRPTFAEIELFLKRKTLAFDVEV